MGKTAPPNRIRELREALKMSQQELADRVQPKTSQPQIDRLEKGQRSLDTKWMGRLAPALGVAPAALMAAQPTVDAHKNANTEGSVASSEKGAVAFVPGTRSTGLRDLPIRGHTKAGVDGVFLDQGETWGFAMRPESLRGVAEAYAVRVHDDCMMPRYKPGTVLQVDPFRRPNPEDNVVIQLKNGQCYVKELVRRAGGLLVCQQYNPKKTVEYKLDKVAAVHLVVGVDYLER